RPGFVGAAGRRGATARWASGPQLQRGQPWVRLSTSAQPTLDPVPVGLRQANRDEQGRRPMLRALLVRSRFNVTGKGSRTHLVKANSPRGATGRRGVLRLRTDRGSVPQDEAWSCSFQPWFAPTTKN